MSHEVEEGVEFIGNGHTVRAYQFGDCVECSMDSA
jgi:hypothetical protein